MLDALALGYRHVDTARAYGNEREVGRALADAGVPREEIWLTTKVWRDDAAPGELRRVFEEQLADLGVDHVDLLLLHWPAAPPLAQTLGAMEELRAQGVVRHVGVSNFPSALLRQAIELAPIFCDQVEYHPYLAQGPVMHECLEHDVLLTAYSPFAHGHVHEDPLLREIGARHGKSAGQVVAAVAARPAERGDAAEGLQPRPPCGEPRRLRLRPDDEERAAVAALARRHLRTADPEWAPEWD